LIVEGNFSQTAGFVSENQLLPHQPDAIFTASDVIALGVLRGLHESGFHIQVDIALVCFNDVPFAQETFPPLTTIHQPIQCIGVIAAQTLAKTIANPEIQPQQIILPAELVIRQSCEAEILSP
jgi:LacI family transcriptional regulator